MAGYPGVLLGGDRAHLLYYLYYIILSCITPSKRDYSRSTAARDLDVPRACFDDVERTRRTPRFFLRCPPSYPVIKPTEHSWRNMYNVRGIFCLAVYSSGFSTAQRSIIQYDSTLVRRIAYIVEYDSSVVGIRRMRCVSAPLVEGRRSSSIEVSSLLTHSINKKTGNEHARGLLHDRTYAIDRLIDLLVDR